MNLFRSEEHARSWPGFDPALEARMLKPVAAWAEIFANPFFRERLRPDYLSWTQSASGRAAFQELRRALAGT
ncbi:MAG: hypothetical protein OEV40_21355 [Acidimicrobiia bacterium]|nr:hypothetical protein [Acidimicrobiia bacterium]